MKSLRNPKKSKSWTYLIFVFSAGGFVFLFIPIFLLHSFKLVDIFYFLQVQDVDAPTSLEHIVFGIAATRGSWQKRKEYIRQWWRPHQMRGCVFLDSLPPGYNTTNDTSIPQICISEDTSRFRYTYRGGLRSAIRIARVVLETVALNHSDVRWYVFGDDDTIFFPENLMKTLSKYDHELWHYVGSHSEIYEQNKVFSFGMAFGGAGFAVSYPLAQILAKKLDSCIERYPHLYGSDSRIHSCLAELGIGVTEEEGFHQFDIRGNAFGLLAAHPVTPLVSLHHFDYIDPIFPNMTTQQALKHLFAAVNVDSQRTLQRTICYDRWFSWTVSVSWGYAVQIFEKNVLMSDALHVEETFRPWKKTSRVEAGLYAFNTRQVDSDPCRRPTLFFMDSVASVEDEIITSTYKKSYYNCSYDKASPKKLEVIKVFSHKLELGIKQLQSPRRQCCDVLPSSVGDVMEISIRECKEEELVYMH